MSSWKKLSSLAASLLVAAATVAALPPRPAAATPEPAKAKTASEDPEVKMGREAHEELLKSGIKFIRDPKVVSRVETIGKKIAAIANEAPIPTSFGSEKFVKYDYKFFVIDDKEVNAFSLPGGYIYFNKGLLDYVQSDDELAGIVAHEVTHALHHHVARLQHEQSKLTSQMAIGLLALILARAPSTDTYNVMTGLQLLAVQKVNGHSQNAERDADHGAVLLARKAGYNPVGALTVMERFARDEKARPDIEQGIARTHPPSRERADAMIAQIKGAGLPINRREVTNAIKASTRTAEVDEEKMTELVLDGKVLYRSASADRVQRAAQTINRLLDQDLQIYDVKQDGPRVLARGQTILSVQPEEAALSQMGSAEAVAEQAYKVLRNALYKEYLERAY